MCFSYRIHQKAAKAPKCGRLSRFQLPFSRFIKAIFKKPSLLKRFAQSDE